MSLKKNRFPSTASMLLVTVTLFAIIVAWSSPLLGTPTTEAALFLGFFLALPTLLAGVCRGAYRIHGGYLDDLFREGLWVFGCLFAYLMSIWVHSWFMTSCSPSSGVFPFLIIVLPQLLLNLATGVWIGRLIGRVRLAVIVTMGLWLGYLGLNVMLWWVNPSLRFFEPFWLMIVGDLVQGQYLQPAVIAYKFSNFLLALGLIAIGVQSKKHASQFWIACFLFSTAAIIQWQSSLLIEPAYSERVKEYPDLKTEGLIVLHTNLSQVSENQAKALLQEASLWLSRLKQRTGIESHKPIHIWLYQDQNSLARYMGAKNVHFALPSHREVHITGVEVPHPTLGHELAHVVLGEASQTVWGIPGAAWILPNWGLSEGLATYLTPELNLKNSLTIDEQSLALYRLGLEKHPESLLSLDLWSFWLNASSRNYIASASVIGAYINQRCQDSDCMAKTAVDLASSGDIQLSNEFVKLYHLRMQQDSLPPDALPFVAKQYASASIVFSDCSVFPKPRIEKSLEQQGDELALNREFQKAAQKYAQVQMIELPLNEQRQILIKQSFLNSSPYASAGLELLAAPIKTPLGLGAAYGKLGASLVSGSNPDDAYRHASYLLARAAILSGNFKFGAEKMPADLTGLLGIESKRLLALAKSQMGQAEQAALDFESLRSNSTRAADKILFADLAERARWVAEGKMFLLGVWENR